MTKRETYEQKTEQLLLPIMEEHQFELVDVEYVYNVDIVNVIKGRNIFIKFTNTIDDKLKQEESYESK